MSNIDVLVEVCVSLATDGNSGTENHRTKRQRLASYANFELDSYSQPSATSRRTTIPLLNGAADETDDDINDDDDDETSSTSSVEIDYEERSAMELLAWQETQISRCIIDNTVNQALESYLALIDEADQAALAHHANQSSNNTTADVEESAISMAINEHGLLQQQPHSSELIEPVHSNENPTNCIHPSNEQATIGDLSVAVDCDNVDDDDDDDDDDESDDLIYPSESMDSDHVNFMEAAIAVAIQKKGLASYR